MCNKPSFEFRAFQVLSFQFLGFMSWVMQEGSSWSHARGPTFPAEHGSCFAQQETLAQIFKTPPAAILTFLSVWMTHQSLLDNIITTLCYMLANTNRCAVQAVLSPLQRLITKPRQDWTMSSASIVADPVRHSRGGEVRSQPVKQPVLQTQANYPKQQRPFVMCPCCRS